MDKAFQHAAQVFRQQAPNLTHTQAVQRLYRKGLKTLGSWAVDRQVFLEEAAKMRDEFEANRNVDPASMHAARLLEAAEDRLFDYSHPDRYCTPWMPGGSKFMRNPPVPLSVAFPDGVPPEKDVGTINVDMTPVRPGEEKRSLLVDFGKKNVE
eukprot:g1345.t1